MRFLVNTILLVALATCVAAQDFECQGPPCLYTFPVGKAALGDCEAISWNGNGSTTVDIDNGCGFPCTGTQYLRMVASGPEFVGPCQPPVVFTTANVVYVPIPVAATTVSLCWDFYNCEGPFSGANDGMVIDFIDSGCTQLAPLVFADTFKPLGPCVDAGSAICPSGCSAVELVAGTVGPEVVSGAPIPAGASFLRIAVWNGTTNTNPSHGVVDGIVFGTPANCPGTESTFGDDITGTGFITGVPQTGTNHTIPVGDYMGFTTTSPGGTCDFAPLFVIADVYTCPFGPPAPFIPGELCVGVGFTLLEGGPGPLGLPLVLAPAPGGFNVTYGPNPGFPIPMCIKIQGVVLSPCGSGLGGVIASTDCHTFTLL